MILEEDNHNIVSNNNKLIGSSHLKESSFLLLTRLDTDSRNRMRLLTITTTTYLTPSN